MTPLSILFVCAEYAPLAKVGGLADMTAGLASYLASQGHDVRILLPDYGGTDLESTEGIELASPRLQRALHDPPERLRVWRDVRQASGPTVYRLSCPQLFGAPEIYAGSDDDGKRFVVMSLAAIDLAGALCWQPDIVHCHDWQAALVPVLMRATDSGFPSKSRSVLTLHNLGYQGIFGEDLLEDTGLDGFDSIVRQTVEPGETASINLLASGIRHADALTTVSPTYAREIQTEAYGVGLHELIADASYKLTGILNGADYSLWDPETDDHLLAPYSAQRPEGKARNKQALLVASGFDSSTDAPVIGLVTRLVPQKGIDLVLEALPLLLDQRDFFCVFLGDGDARYVSALRALAARHPDRVAFARGYDERLAHRIFAGSDAFLVPSLYEPCGLTQIYALRYGTIPVVRATGGLADTVQHFDASSGTGNGCVFEHADSQGLAWAMQTTLEWLANPEIQGRLRANAMAADFSWARQGPLYEALYGSLLRASEPPVI